METVIYLSFAFPHSLFQIHLTQFQLLVHFNCELRKISKRTQFFSGLFINEHREHREHRKGERGPRIIFNYVKSIEQAKHEMNEVTVVSQLCTVL